jgi:hypothetical protein
MIFCGFVEYLVDSNRAAAYPRMLDSQLSIAENGVFYG